MLESEPCRRDTACVVKNDIKRVLLTADAVALTAWRLDLDLNEFGHLLVEPESRGFGATTSFIPDIVRGDKVLESANP